MISLSKNQIKKHALGQGSITFLKSEKMAKEVKARVEGLLPDKYSVCAEESRRYPGTWHVVVDRITLPGVSYVNVQINARECDEIAAALKKVFRASELVTSYERSLRRR